MAEEEEEEEEVGRFLEWDSVVGMVWVGLGLVFWVF